MPWAAFALPVECYCVMWLRESRGVKINGDAWTIKPNIEKVDLRKGDVILFDYGGIGKDHVAQVVSFKQEHLHGGVYVRKSIRVIEANYGRCKVGYRDIDWDDPAIKGGYRYPHIGVK